MIRAYLQSTGCLFTLSDSVWPDNLQGSSPFCSLTWCETETELKLCCTLRQQSHVVPMEADCACDGF
jgi:hypothetical protein